MGHVPCYRQRGVQHPPYTLAASLPRLISYPEPETHHRAPFLIMNRREKDTEKIIIINQIIGEDKPETGCNTI